MILVEIEEASSISLVDNLLLSSLSVAFKMIQIIIPIIYKILTTMSQIDIKTTPHFKVQSKLNVPEPCPLFTLCDYLNVASS